MTGEARLIGLDWGTSSLRAYLFGDGGVVIDARSRPWGVMALPDGNFARVLRDTVGDWNVAHGRLPAIASGMIGSTVGWVTAPYRACPAGLDELCAGLAAAPTDRPGGLAIVPGVELRGPRPDVMRGEETQIVGALARAPALASDATLILPGTHSKWVRTAGTRIVDFETYVTGELFAVLAEHSILGRPARDARDGSQPGTTSVTHDAEEMREAFDRGVSAVRDNGIRGAAPLLFATRTLVLAGELAAERSLAYLSGVLIGDELRAALILAIRPLALVGGPALCERYARAFALFGLDVPQIDDAAPAGLWAIACCAGLVEGSRAPVDR